MYVMIAGIMRPDDELFADLLFTNRDVQVTERWK